MRIRGVAPGITSAGESLVHGSACRKNPQVESRYWRVRWVCDSAVSPRGKVGGMGIRSVWRRFTNQGAVPELDPARTDLVVVVSSFDDAEACSAALARAVGWRPPEQALLRHHLRVPASSREAVTAIAAQDDYDAYSPAAPARAPERAHTGSAPPGDTSDHIELVLQRVQILDTLHCSQECSRMAGLAQRHDGTVLGWDALQPSGFDPRPD